MSNVAQGPEDVNGVDNAKKSPILVGALLLLGINFKCIEENIVLSNNKWHINKKRITHWLEINNLTRTHNGTLVSDSFDLSSTIPDEIDSVKLKKKNHRA